MKYEDEPIARDETNSALEANVEDSDEGVGGGANNDGSSKTSTVSPAMMAPPPPPPPPPPPVPKSTPKQARGPKRRQFHWETLVPEEETVFSGIDSSKVVRVYSVK